MAFEILVVIVIALFGPFVIDSTLNVLYGNRSKDNSISQEDKGFLKTNYLITKQISNWSFGILLLAGFILLFNFGSIFSTYRLPHYFLQIDYSEIKSLIVVVIMISYWGFVIAKFVSLLIFGKHHGNLVMNYSLREEVDHEKTNLAVNGIEFKSTDEIIHHPYKKLFSTSKIITVTIIASLILII